MSQRDLRRWLEPLRRKIRLIVNRAIVTAVQDAGGLQLVQVKGLPGELLDSLERFQNFGFSSVPVPGAEAVVAFIGASRSHGVVVALDDRRYRPRNLGPGESIVYSKDGDFVRVKNGAIEVQSSGEVSVNAPTVTIEGDSGVTVNGGTVGITGDANVTVEGGTVTINGTTTIENRVFLDHVHDGVLVGDEESGGVV